MNFTAVFSDVSYLLWGAFPNGPIGRAALTLLLTATSSVIAALLGLVLGTMLTMWSGYPRIALQVLTALLRAIPVLMLIFWSYFLLPVLLGLDVPGVISVVSALSLVGGAYLAHAVHAGLEAIGRGQWDAALALGLTRWQALRYVVMPQAIRIMFPSFVNQWVTLIKDSSLAYIVGVSELSFVAAQVNGRTMIYPAEIFIVVGAMYWVLCSGFDLAANRIRLTYEARIPEQPERSLTSA